MRPRYADLLDFARVAVLGFALAGCAGLRPPAAPAPGPSATLAGHWAPASAVLGGKDFPVANFAGATLRLSLDTYDFGGDRGDYSLLAGGPPARMDVHGRVGPNAGRTIPAIYDLAGDALTVCYQLGAGERPADFGSPPGSLVLLVRYRRLP